MRRSFDGLAAMARDVMKGDPFSGHIFVFRNRMSDRVKVLFWDRSGYVIWYKRLEKGRFHLPCEPYPSAEIEAAEMTLLLEGIDLSNSRRRKRWAPPRSNSVSRPVPVDN